MSSSFFQNKDCEYFPCHLFSENDDFNCLFCFCPLYAFGARCGGDYIFTEDGIKDCSGCCIPHRRDSYAMIIERIKELYNS